MSPSVRASIPLIDRMAGGVWGHLIGDAIGVPYEFKPARPADSVVFGAHGTHGQPPGTWSDDGALMLALLDSLLTVGFDTSDQAARALAWADQGRYTPDGDGKFDIGNACSRALDRLRDGTPAEEAGGRGEYDNGNGSLMRILPVALVGWDQPDVVLIEEAHRASSVTHGHPRSLACCALYVLIAARLLHGEGRHDSLASARASLRAAYAGRADGAPLIEALDFIEAYPDRGGRGRVWDSFWSAWDAFAGAQDYQSAIQRAVAYGDDTDTTAAIAGGLAGIYWGISGIPQAWRDGMRGRTAIERAVAHVIVAGQRVGPLTSENNPIRVARVDLSGVHGLAAAPGTLGMTFLPGKHDSGVGGEHRRTLGLDARELREHWKSDVLVLLVEDHELASLVPGDLPKAMADVGIELVRFPIVDQGVPSDQAAFHALTGNIADRIRAGQHVVVACRGGLGRTGTVVACVLREAGADEATAKALTREKRKRAIESAAQERFVAAWQRPS